jgi:hypothetical protein
MANRDKDDRLSKINVQLLRASRDAEVVRPIARDRELHELNIEVREAVENRLEHDRNSGMRHESERLTRKGSSRRFQDNALLALHIGGQSAMSVW